MSRYAAANAMNLVGRNWPGLIDGIKGFFYVSFPAAFLNSTRQYAPLAPLWRPCPPVP